MFFKQVGVSFEIKILAVGLRSVRGGVKRVGKRPIVVRHILKCCFVYVFKFYLLRRYIVVGNFSLV